MMASATPPRQRPKYTVRSVFPCTGAQPNHRAQRSGISNSGSAKTSRKNVVETARNQLASGYSALIMSTHGTTQNPSLQRGALSDPRRRILVVFPPASSALDQTQQSWLFLLRERGAWRARERRRG